MPGKTKQILEAIEELLMTVPSAKTERNTANGNKRARNNSYGTMEGRP